MLEELSRGTVIVGSKQLRKALRDGSVRKVFLARDADPRIVEAFEKQCAGQGVECVWVDTMARLGEACGIEVGSAAAAILK